MKHNIQVINSWGRFEEKGVNLQTKSSGMGPPNPTSQLQIGWLILEIKIKK